MSTQRPSDALSALDIMRRKGGAPLVCLTAYTTPIAKLADRHCDLLLVGDSVGMVLHGLASTVGVTMDMMIMHGKAVRRGATRSLVVVDMPFGSYEESPELAFRNASHLIKETGCSAVKLEGGERMAGTIAFLVQRGIPVMAHIGLTPQSINTTGGYRLQGKGEQAERVRLDLSCVVEAGAFAVVIEMVPENLAAELAHASPVPCIGIGASAACDGQILVVDDMLGMFSEFQPKFVKQYAQLAKAADEAIGCYAAEVRARQFPAEKHVFRPKRSVQNECAA